MDRWLKAPEKDNLMVCGIFKTTAVRFNFLKELILNFKYIYIQ